MRRSRKSQEMVELLDPQLQQFDWAISAGLIALLAFLPAAMGTHEAWNEAIALYVTIAAVIILGVKLVVRADQRFAWTWAYLPIVALVAYIAFQLVPLPLGVLRLLSPGTVADRLKLLADLPARFQQNQFPLSFYPHNTWHDLRNLLATIAVFVVTVNVSRNVSIIKLLLWAMAIIVSAEALLAIVQDLTGATGIYWSFPLPGNLLPNSGTFPNHNFFAQFMNVGSGATLGLLLLTIDQTFHRHDYTPAEMIEKFTSAKFRAAYFLIGMLSLNAASVLLCLSRGGVLAMVISGAFTVLLLVIRGGRRGMGVAGWFAGLAVLFIFILVLAGGAELVESRLQRVANREDQYDRYRLTTDTLKMWRHYPLTGTGFGTYEYVFPRFDSSHTQITATHAEDEYAELLAELGIVGSACVVCFGAMIGWAFFRARDRSRRSDDAKARSSEIVPQSEQRRRPGTSVTSSISIGIGFGLMAMLVQSVTDFAPHFISVSMPAAVLCGLMLNLAFLRQRERAPADSIKEFSPSAAVVFRRRVVRVIGLMVVIGLSAGLIVQAAHAWSSESAWYRVDESQKVVSAAGWKDVDGEATDMNRYATDAIRADPHNVFRHFWRAVYQSYTIDPSLAPSERTRIIESLNDDLQASRMQCPTFGPMLCQIGQWQQNELNRWADGAEAIRLGVWLAPNDSTANFVAGGLYADEGHWDQAMAAFQNAISLEHEIISDIMDVVLDTYHRPESVLPLAQTNIVDLRLAAAKLRKRDPAAAKAIPPAQTDPAASRPTPTTISVNESIALEAERRVDLEIEREAAQPDATSVQLAEMAMLCVRRNQPAAALPYFDRSLLLNYGNGPLRVNYARALIAAHDDDEALRQLKIVQRMYPNDGDCRALSEQILVRRAMSDPNIPKSNIPLLPPD